MALADQHSRPRTNPRADDGECVRAHEEVLKEFWSAATGRRFSSVAICRDRRGIFDRVAPPRRRIPKRRQVAALQMKALRYENKKLSVTDVPEPRVDGEAVVRVTLSGICNTDLEIARGYAGFEGTIGHEFVGVIESVSEARASARASQPGEPSLTVGLLTPGRRVVGEINAGCGVCDLCRAGDPRHCARRTVLGIVGRDGAHAEFLKLPAVNLLPVPDEISDQSAVLTEPLAAACGILERAEGTEE